MNLLPIEYELRAKIERRDAEIQTLRAALDEANRRAGEAEADRDKESSRAYLRDDENTGLDILRKEAIARAEAAESRTRELECEVVGLREAADKLHYSGDVQIEFIQRQLDGINGASEYSSNLLNALRESLKRMRGEWQGMKPALATKTGAAVPEECDRTGARTSPRNKETRPQVTDDLELRAFLAREVMGLVNVHEDDCCHYPDGDPEHTDDPKPTSSYHFRAPCGDDPDGRRIVVPRCESDPAAMMLVIERMHQRDPEPRQPRFRLVVKQAESGVFYATFTGDWGIRMGGAEHKELPRAVALAAREAVTQGANDAKETP